MGGSYTRLPRDSTEEEEDRRLLADHSDQEEDDNERRGRPSSASAAAATALTNAPKPKKKKRGCCGCCARLGRFFTSETFFRCFALSMVLTSSILLTIGLGISRSAVVGPIMPWFTFVLAVCGLTLHIHRGHLPADTATCERCHNPLARSRADVSRFLGLVDFAVIILLILSSTAALASRGYNHEAGDAGAVLGILSAFVHIAIPFYFIYGAELKAERRASRDLERNAPTLVLTKSNLAYDAGA